MAEDLRSQVSGQNIRLEHTLDLGDAILQLQFALFQATQYQIILGRGIEELSNSFVEIAMLDGQFLQTDAQGFCIFIG